MEAPKRTRSCRRERLQAASPEEAKVTRGDRQICLAMTRQQYAEMWDAAPKLREHIENLIPCQPELWPPEVCEGFQLTGKLPESKKLPGIQLRQLRLKAGGPVYTLRPSFVMPYMMGMLKATGDDEVRRKPETRDIENGLLLLTNNVPAHLVVWVCGGDEMFWMRLMGRLGRNSLVGTTVRDPERLPEHLAADEHHADWRGKKGFVTMTSGNDCILGVAVTAKADDPHLQEAYGDVARECQNVKPDYAPQTVNADGWAATHKAFRQLFPQIVVILCFLHGFLKIRDRCRKAHDLHEQIWHVYKAENKAEFEARMQGLKEWFEARSWSAAVVEAVGKLLKRAPEYAESYAHPGCHRTSNAVDRPMNALHRQIYAGRGLHGHQHTSELRLRGWALVYNFRPFAERSGQPRPFNSRAHRLNAKQYSKHWLENLMLSASRGGRNQRT